MNPHPEEREEPFTELERARLRDQLAAVELPPGMIARLEAIPARHPRPWWRTWGRVAAVLVFAAGVALSARWEYGRQQQVHLQDLVTEVVEVHEQGPAVAVTAEDPDVLAKALRAAPSQAGIRADIYPPAEGTILVGGGTRQLEGKTVYYSVYERAGKRYTLFQAGIEAFGLPTKFEKGRRSLQDRAGHEVVVETWPDATYGCGWLLVSGAGGAPPRELLKTEGGVW